MVRGGDYRRLREGDDVAVLYAPESSRPRSIIYECAAYFAIDDCGRPIHSSQR